MLMSSARTSDARSAVRTCVPRVLLRPRVAGPWSLPHMRVRAPRRLETSLRAIPGRNVAEIFFAGGGLCEMTLTDEQQTALVRAVAKHLLALREIPDLLPHLHVDVDAVEVRPSSVCDGLGVFATRKIRSHELVTLFPASNEVSLCVDRDGGAPAKVWRPATYEPSVPSDGNSAVATTTFAVFNGHPYFGRNALRIEAASVDREPPQRGFLGHVINDAATPPREAEDLEYARQYLTRTTNETNCHAVPFPSGAVCVAASRDIEEGEELLITYSFAYDAGFMSEMLRRPDLREKMLTNAFATEMKVASVKMEQLTKESSRIHAQAEILTRELLIDAADEDEA